MNLLGEFSENSWEIFGLPMLENEELLLLGVASPLPNIEDQHAVLEHQLFEIIKRIRILEIQPYLILLSNQSEVDIPEKIAHFKIEFKNYN